MASLEVLSCSPLPAAQPASERYFNQCFAAMDAALPNRHQDDRSGELIARTYRKMLGHLTREAITHVAERSMAECKWFPTIAECLAFAKEFVQPPHPFREVRDMARGLIGRERLQRFSEAMAKLDAGQMPLAEFEALPMRWRGMAVESGRVWSLRGGGYAICPINPEDRATEAARLMAEDLL